MSDEITLEWYEVRLAVGVGVLRMLNALKDGKADAHGFNGDGWQAHIEGACGELALAKCCGMYWAGSVNTYREGPDVGHKTIQVKTRSRGDYELLVRPHDDDASAYVLVTGKLPTYCIHGWMFGAEAKREEWLQTHGGRPPAYFVPQAALWPISDLRFKRLCWPKL
jgi:hypothetical protein